MRDKLQDKFLQKDKMLDICRMMEDIEALEIQRLQLEIALRRNEEEVRCLRRMMGVTNLAGGIAHHFNNIIAVVTGYGSMLQNVMEKDDPLKKYVDKMMIASERAAELTRKLLALSGQEPFKPKLADLNDTIKRAEKLLSTCGGSNIEVKLSTADQDLPVLMDVSKIEDVLGNLIVNAYEAMPDGGVLTISTKGEALGTYKGGKNPGICACLSIKDTGMGMDKKTKEKACEPFYTTKGLATHAGLGLSIAYGLVKQHNGAMSIESKPGKGTTVHILFPLAGTRTLRTKPLPLLAPAIGRRLRLCRDM
ncbi:MAG: Blue-light-activated protein [Syntrophorhabdus sp. PtaU1.Bin050]|nr:MAG: Blue-light-activated protein [Syntrophorhabdus sp. PtaU1.Bin050]